MSGGQQVDVFANESIPPADLQPLLLDHADRDDRKCSGLGPDRLARAQEHHRCISRTAGPSAEPDAQRRRALGPPGDHRRLGRDADRSQERLRAAPRLRVGSRGARHSKVFGSFGRYYEEIPMDLVIRSFSYERQPRIINYSPTSTAPDPQAEADLGPTRPSSAASPSRPIPISRTSTSTNTSSATSAR